MNNFIDVIPAKAGIQKFQNITGWWLEVYSQMGSGVTKTVSSLGRANRMTQG